MSSSWGCASLVRSTEDGKKRLPSAEREGIPAGEEEGARLVRGWLLRCFLDAERRRWESGVGRGAPGKGRSGSGPGALEVPGARAERDERGGGRNTGAGRRGWRRRALKGPRAPCTDPPAGSGRRRAPTLASGSIQVLRESLGGMGRKRDYTGMAG